VSSSSHTRGQGPRGVRSAGYGCFQCRWLVPWSAESVRRLVRMLMSWDPRHPCRCHSARCVRPQRHHPADVSAAPAVRLPPCREDGDQSCALGGTAPAGPASFPGARQNHAGRDSAVIPPYGAGVWPARQLPQTEASSTNLTCNSLRKRSLTRVNRRAHGRFCTIYLAYCGGALPQSLVTVRRPQHSRSMGGLTSGTANGLKQRRRGRGPAWRSPTAGPSSGSVSARAQLP
jgi:hypothetical protein